jgi:hypothetical protein
VIEQQRGISPQAKEAQPLRPRLSKAVVVLTAILLLAPFVGLFAYSMSLDLTVAHFAVLLLRWQTLVTGFLALAAAVLTVIGTMSAAKEQVDGTTAAADRQVAAAHRQVQAMLHLERRRIARESYAFYALLNAAMDVVLTDVAEARRIFGGAATTQVSFAAFIARQRVTKAGFADIRRALISLGGNLSRAFLLLEVEIDEFRSRVTTIPTAGAPQNVGMPEGFSDQIDRIQMQATQLRYESEVNIDRCLKMLKETPELSDM